MKQLIFIVFITSLLFLVACGTETIQETCNIVTGECSGEEVELTDAEQNCKDNQGFLDKRESETYCIFNDGTECKVEECDFEKEEETTEVEEEVETTPTEYTTQIRVKEGEKVKVNVEATDADGDKLTYKFDAPLNNNGEWQTKEGDEGNYEVEVIVSDGEAEAKSVILVMVEALNKAPTLEVKGNLEVNEGEEVILEIITSDNEDDEVIITVFNPKFIQEGKVFTWKTGFNDAGEYDIKVEASDGKSGVSETITVIVKDKNRAPVITQITQE
ncbi:PKD domain-containing protein [Candidatus Woesearchaeota archaeon]|nr:PKD domain-containing protein [Candidatus Woesearchaeota archaeon]